jgi:centromeric protein E
MVTRNHQKRRTQKNNKNEEFKFHRTFGQRDSNQDVYEDAVSHLVQACMTGFNASVITYGQGGSGKTFTMTGSGSSSPGIMQFATIELFDYIANHPERDFLLRVSMYDVHNETIHALLADNASSKSHGQNYCYGKNGTDLQIQNHAQRGVVIKGLTESIVTSAEQVLALLLRGTNRRQHILQAINRSQIHKMFSITIESKPRLKHTHDSDEVNVSTLTLVDLSGPRLNNTISDRANNKNAAIATRDFEDSKKLNHYLVQLNACVQQLVKQQAHSYNMKVKCDKIERKSCSTFRNSKLMSVYIHKHIIMIF